MLSTRHRHSQPGSAAGALRPTPLDAVDGLLSACVSQSPSERILSLAFQPREILRKGEICNQFGLSRRIACEVRRLIGRLEPLEWHQPELCRTR